MQLPETDRAPSANGAVAPDQRFRNGDRCPICGGSETDPRGHGSRCHGFRCENGKSGFCSRPEHAGLATFNQSTNAYLHHYEGDCPCGMVHAPADPHPAGNLPLGTIEAVYDYRDERSQLLYQVVRYKNPKDFRQRRADPSGKKKWLWKLGDVRRVPYRLPELLSADSEDVFVIVEGEKDVDRLVSLGFVTTCNPMGAKKWRNEYSPLLQGRHVVIIQDNDDDGRKHAQQVAKSVSTYAASVKVLELDGLPDGGDVSDWLDAGGTAEELGRLIRQAAQWEQRPSGEAASPQAAPDGPATHDDNRINLTDLGNARRLVKLAGKDTRYCFARRVWVIWDGTRWKEDQTGQVFRLAKQAIRTIGAETANAGDDNEAKAILKWALKSESKKLIDATVDLARSEPGIPVEPSQLDRNPMLLNVANGTIDLTTGRLHPHRQTDLITKLIPIPYDATAKCPRWEAFLDRIMDHQQEVIDFLRRAAGYAATGSTAEHALFFLYGNGRNGKSTFLDTLLSILGDYATTIDASMLTVKRNEDHPTGLTDLDGRRFVSTVEVEDGKRMAEALVKKLTGDRRIKARRMRENNYEFEPTHKLFLAANHQPEIRGTDEGIWSRIKLVPFNVFVPPEERVKDLDKILVAEEGPGILAWLVRGALEWQLNGLAEPKAISKATADYRSEMDAIGDFLSEKCECPTAQHLKENAKVLASTLYQAYSKWAVNNGVEAIPSRRFGSEIGKRGFRLDKSNGKCWRIGLCIRNDNNHEDENKIY